MAVLGKSGSQTALAAVAYTALTAVMTWPVAAGLGRDVPGDLGDPLLVMGVMAWVAEGLVAIARGDMAFADLWNAYFFAPTPLSLTFSEHFVPQAVLGLPVYLATGNILLAYNLAFFSSFALSGLGTFLLVRELTGSARAAFVAGLFYAFFPYRLMQYPHLQTLSSQWMPLALFGFRRHFDTGRWLPLAGGTAAFVVQGLSSGYYLFYFAPVLAGYVLWELVVRRGQWRAWAPVTLAGAAAIAATLPFLLPYAEARARLGHSRPFGEVLGFSANLLAYVNAPHQLPFWGARLTPWPQVEGDLFAGAVPLTLGAAAVALWAAGTAAAFRRITAEAPSRERRLARTLMVLGVLLLAGTAVVVTTGGFVWDLAGVPIRMTNVRRTSTYAAICVAAALALSPRLRAALVASRPRDLTPFLVLAIAFAVIMSLGPLPRVGTRPIVGLGLYDTFFHSVPGYDGLRVPARFGMVAASLLAVLAGYALARIARWRRGGAVALTVLGGLFMAEAWAAPVATNLTWSSSARYGAPWPDLHRLNDGPLAYRYMVGMPAGTTLIELPFGDQAWDLRYVYYAGLHGKRIVNGYSGYFPAGYLARAARLSGLWSDPAAAWEALTSSGATHVLIHLDAFVGDEGEAVARWAEQAGATPLAWFEDGAALMALPPR